MMAVVKILCLLALVQTLAFAGDRKATAADVVGTVFTSLCSDHDDARLAQALNAVQLTEQLSPHILRYFQTLRLGPKSSAVLERLVESSASMANPQVVPFSIQPLPSQHEQSQMLRNVIHYAQAYVQNLPNFLCDQITERYTNLHGFAMDGNPRYGKALRRSDRFTRSLRFVGGREEGETTRVGGRRVAGKFTLEDVASKKGQSISTGEFGGDMALIFGTGVDADVHWDHWETLRRKRMAVFNYFVGAQKTQFSLYFCCTFAVGRGDVQQTCKAPIRGLVYLDAESGVILKLTIQAVNLPPDFHIKESNTVIDYDNVLIGNRQYILPVKAIVFVRSENQLNRNEIAFVKYRKFEAESVFTYTDSRVTSITDPKE